MDKKEYKSRKARYIQEIERNEKLHCSLVAAKWRRELEMLEKAMEPVKKTVTVDGRRMHLVFGKSVDEWARLYGSRNGDLWNVPFEELADGTLDINEGIWYWYIEGRCYETDEEADQVNEQE